MQCNNCQRPYQLLTSQPYIICSNKHTICEHCVVSATGKDSVCKRCSEHVASPKLCFTTLYNINNGAPRGTLVITFVLVAALVGYLVSLKKLQLKDLENLRGYLLVTATYYFVGQWLTLLFRVIPEVVYLRKNPEQAKRATPYLFSVIIRQASLWNCQPKTTALGVMFGLLRYSWLTYNIYQYHHKIEGFGSEFVLSLVVSVLSMGDLPLFNRLLIHLNHLIKLFAQGIAAVVRPISQVILETVVYAIVVLLAALSFYGYLCELNFIQIFEFKAKHIWWAFPVPLLLNRYVLTAGTRWLSMLAYQNVSLVLPVFFRRNVLLDLLIALAVLPKLLFLGGTVMYLYFFHHVIGVNLEMKLEVCSVLNILLTPMHISLYMLLKEVQL